MDGIDHCILGAAGVNRFAADRDDGACRVETLVLEFSEQTAVHRIGKIRTESLDVKIIRAFADLFVRREGKSDFAVRDLGMRDKIFERGHDRRDTRLVIGAEECRAVGRDDFFADEPLERGKILRRHHELAVFDRAALIDEPTGILTTSGHLRRGVHMRDKGNRLESFDIRLNRAVEIAVFLVKIGTDSHLVEFLPEHVRKRKDRGIGWMRMRIGIRLRVHGDIF